MLKIIKACAITFATFICQSSYTQNISVQFYYLGHSSFVIIFDNELSVLTDYGEPNAYVEYGWNSPIYEIGDFHPTIVTYSHLDDDHYDSTRIPLHASYVLKKADTLKLNNLTIFPIFTSEDNMSIKNNTSFLLNYKGVNILHLGDCQANIINIDSIDNKNYIKNSIPMNCDVVLMPIEGKSKFLFQTEKFIKIIHPKTVIPMHYWSDAYKQDFFSNLIEKAKDDKSGYRIYKTNSSTYTYVKSVNLDSISIINVYPSKFDNKALNKNK